MKSFKPQQSNELKQTIQKIILNVQFMEETYELILPFSTILNKVFKMVQIYFSDQILSRSFSIFYNPSQNKNIINESVNIDLSKINQEINMNELIEFLNLENINQNVSNQLELNLVMKIIDLNDNSFEEKVNEIHFTCFFEDKIHKFSLLNSQNFEKLKFNILAKFPQLENANYTIDCEGIDITNIFSDDKVLRQIFIKDLNKDCFVSNIKIDLHLRIKPKHFVKYIKKCSECHVKIADFICVDCSKAYCNNCTLYDIHYNKENLKCNSSELLFSRLENISLLCRDYIEQIKLMVLKTDFSNVLNSSSIIGNIQDEKQSVNSKSKIKSTDLNNSVEGKLVMINFFKLLENNTINEFLSFLNTLKVKYKSSEFTNFSKNSSKIFNNITNSIDENVNLLNKLNNYETENLSNILKKISLIINPEKVEDIIDKIYNRINKYLKDPYFDCEESMLQINFYYLELSELYERFDYCLYMIRDFFEKSKICLEVNQKIKEFLKSQYDRLNTLFNKSSLNYTPIMKVLDNKRILSYQHVESDNNIISNKDEFLVFRTRKYIERYDDENNNYLIHLLNKNSSEIKSKPFNSNNLLKYTDSSGFNNYIEDDRSNKHYLNYNNMLINEILQRYSTLDLKEINLPDSINNNDILNKSVKNNFYTTEKSDKNGNFSILQFYDNENLFYKNLSNYVQVNLNNHLFIITGSQMDKLFFYNRVNNEMKFITNLNNNHIWWPSLVILSKEIRKLGYDDSKEADDQKQINNINYISHELYICCFSGSYTKKCEGIKFKVDVFDDEIVRSKKFLDIDFLDCQNSCSKMKFTLETKFEDFSEISTSRGQASSCVVNNSTCYLFFGYDNNGKSISTIEKFDIKSNIWSEIKYTNIGEISALLYYHSNLNINNKEIKIFGGMKDINIYDKIYNFNLEEGKLSKENTNNKGNYRFQNEKNFIKISYDYISKSKNNSNNSKNLKLSNNTEMDYEIEKILNQSMYCLFDNENNVHIYKESSKEYKFIKFNNDLI